MADSRRAHAGVVVVGGVCFPVLLLLVSLSPWWATATPRLCRRPSNTSRC